MAASTLNSTASIRTGKGVPIDLGRARLSLPWIGWSKEAVSARTATFEASGPADNTQLKNFVLKGDGFGANGSLVIGKGNLVKADLDSVKLSSLDDFAVSVKRNKGGLDVSVSGNSADARPIISRLKAGSNGGSDDDKSGSVSVRAKLGRIVGFNDEKMRNVDMLYVSADGRLQSLNLSGVTDSGEAFVAQTKGNGVINITSGDAGSVSRFADLYQHMMGGLLNLQIRLGAGDSWDGSIDIRRFSSSMSSACTRSFRRRSVRSNGA